MYFCLPTVTIDSAYLNPLSEDEGARVCGSGTRVHPQVLQTSGNTAECDFTLFIIPLSGADVAKRTKLPQSNLCLKQKTLASNLYSCIIKNQLIRSSIATKLPSLVIKNTLTADKMHLNFMSTDAT